MPAAIPHPKQHLRIGLLDFEPLSVVGFKSICEPLSHVSIVSTTPEAVLRDSTLDMVLLGPHHPTDAFDLLARLKAAQPRMSVIVMGAETDEETILSAIAAGAKGYLEESATAGQVISCIDVVASGSIWAPRKVLSAFVDRMLSPESNKPVRRHNLTFTQREEQVLALLQAACSNREIAVALGIEERTVKAYIAKLIRKAGVENRVALSVRAERRGQE